MRKLFVGNDCRLKVNLDKIFSNYERLFVIMKKLFVKSMFSLSFLALVLSNFSIGGITADKPASAAEELTGSTQDTTNLAQRIRRFEDGLLQPNVIKGQPPAKMKLADRMKAYKTPGASIAVINNYKIEWARGYGVRDTETNEAVNLDTLFQAASISKPVTTMAVLRLVQQGKLNLDEDVNKKLVSWKVPENEFTRDKKVTIRGILTHTAGFDVFFYDGTPVGELAPTALQLLKGEKPATTPPLQVVYTPGSKNIYTSGGFLVLMQLLVDVTGKPFPQLMEELVFSPLGMKNSTFAQPLPQNLQQRAAAGVQRGEPVKGKWLIKANMASGGLWTTASDLAKFAVELQKARLGKSNKVLSKETANLMIPPREAQISGGDGTSVKVRGLGIGVAGEGQTIRFNHGGNNTGYRSEMVIFGNGQGFVILTNGSSQAILRETLRSIATEYDWASYGSAAREYLPIERTLVSVEPRVLETYVGEYEYPVGRNPRVSVVSIKNGHLHLDGEPLQAQSETSFFGRGESTYTFNKDEKGQVIEMVDDVIVFKLTAKKIK